MRVFRRLLLSAVLLAVMAIGAPAIAVSVGYGFDSGFVQVSARRSSDNSLVFAETLQLGGTGANSFVIMRDVPPACTAVGTPARIVRRGGRNVDEELPPTRLSERSIPVGLPNDASRPVSTGG